MEVVQEVHTDLKKGFHLKEFGKKLGCCSQHLLLLPMRNVKNFYIYSQFLAAKAWTILLLSIYMLLYTFYIQDIHIHICNHHATIWSAFLVKDIKTPSEKTKHAMHPENCCDWGHGMRPRLRWPILRQGREIPLGIWSFRSEHEWIIGEHRKQKWFNPTLKKCVGNHIWFARRWKGTITRL